MFDAFKQILDENKVEQSLSLFDRNKNTINNNSLKSPVSDIFKSR